MLETLAPPSRLASPAWADAGAGADVVASAQRSFRARQHRKQAVRVIERAYSEWKYHAEQARLAAEGAADASVHTYHAERRERAAKCIQSLLSRQTARPHGGAGLGAAPAEGWPYTPEQIALIRHAQRAFRAHMAQHAVDARALQLATLGRASGGPTDAEDAEVARLCAILRKAAAGVGLDAAEQAMLVRLQLSMRETMMRRRARCHRDTVNSAGPSGSSAAAGAAR